MTDSDEAHASDPEPRQTTRPRVWHWQHARRWVRDRAAAFGAFPAVMWLACVALATPHRSILPGTELDPSWMLGLNVARHHGLRFGPQLLFTYGPWGFLDTPLAVSGSNLVLGALFGIAVVGGAWWVFYRVFGRVLPSSKAALAATALVALASQVTTGSSVLSVAVAVVAIDFVAADSTRRRWLPAAVAGCAALVLQIKFSEGVALTVVGIGCAGFAPSDRVRRCAEAVAAYLIVTVAAWLLAGQSLGDLPAWLRGSVEIARGYTDAMALEAKPNVLSYLLMVAVMCISGAYLVRMARDRRDLRATLGVLVTGGMMLFLGFREASGRHGAGHQDYFFLFALPVLAWFVPVARSLVLRSAVLVVAVLLSAGHWEPVEPQAAFEKWGTLLQAVVDGKYRSTELAHARVAARQQYRLSPAMISAVGARPVAVDGWETTLPYAYNMNWRPAPVFQPYSAYTARLDELNATSLATAPARQVILRPLHATIDGRNKLWDPPRSLLTELCHYRAVASDQRWLLLSKSTDRCSRPSVLATRHVEAGQPVAVPTAGPDQLVVVSFAERSASLPVRAGRLLVKSYHRLTVTADGTAFRVPRALADGPLLAAVPAASGWPAAFGGSTSYPSLTFSEGGTAVFSVINLNS